MRDHPHFARFLMIQEQHHGRITMDDMVNAHRRVPDSTPPPSTSPGGRSPSPLGFPLGTALILFIVFGVSTLFSCCYHWEKIRSHARRFTTRATSTAAAAAAATSTDPSANSAAVNATQSMEQSKCSKQAFSLPVMMPGDEIPKYVAWPSPHGSLEHGDDGAAHCSSQCPSPASKEERRRSPA